MIRRLTLIALIVALATSFAWASGSKESGAAASGQSLKLQSNGMPEYTGAPATLTFWSWVPGIDKAVAAFEKAYPNIKVKWENVGNGTAEYSKLITAMQAGSGAPDVAQIEYQAIPTFINQGGLVDLAKHGAQQVKDQFVPWTWAQVSRGSSVYAIPQDTGPLAFAYRKDIYDKYGLTVPKTWQEFAADAKKLHDATNGKVYMTNFDAVGSGNGSYLLGLVWADGGNIWKLNGDTWTQTLDSAKVNKVANFWMGLIKNGEVGTVTAASYLEGIASRFPDPSHDLELELRTGHAPDEIVRFSIEQPHSVVVMSTHGASGFERMRRGSVTDAVVRGAATPTLVVPPVPSLLGPAIH